MIRRYEYVPAPFILCDGSVEDVGDIFGRIDVYVGTSAEIAPIIKSLYRSKYAPVPMDDNRPYINKNKIYGIEVYTCFDEYRSWFDVVNADELLHMFLCDELKERKDV